MRNFLRPWLILALIVLSSPIFSQYIIEEIPQDRITVSALAGLNFAWKSADRATDTTSSYTNPAFALQGWYRSVLDIGTGGFSAKLQPGIFAGYIPVYSYKDSVTAKKSSDVKFPFLGEVRLVHSTGVFAGAGGGYAYTVITQNDITEAKGGAAVISFLAGYAYELPYRIQVGFTLRGLWFLQQLEAANGTRTANNNFNLMPALTVGYAF